MSKPLRCAVYTRKSSEEGLDQAFNSLHAQREACEAYVKSQTHEGWRLVKTSYDDGGYSGGSMARPALQRLLAEVMQGQINVVVVYKVDRLTRSLADFARIVEALDRRGASFVSVTQQFNTTTSMGRLTLNVLLSFAQFEREVTGERIRDKVAASRRKGMWMGGTVPMGYDVKQRTLVVNETEAATVRDIFETYIRLGSVASLQQDLERRRVVSKRWTSSTGRTRGGVAFNRGALYWLLRNPIYFGRVSHKGQLYEGRQAAIVDKTLWDQAQALLSAKSATRERRRALPTGRPLAGRLFDDKGNAMSPAYTTKRNGQRYHYYVSQALLRGEKANAGAVARVPAFEIERLVLDALSPVADGRASIQLFEQIQRVLVHPDRIEIAKASADGAGKDDDQQNGIIVVKARLGFRNRRMVLDDGRGKPDPVVLKALARAHEWRSWLEKGQAHSYQQVASKAGVTHGHVQKVLPFAFLAPRLTRDLLHGRRQLSGGLMAQLRRGIPLDWDQQLDVF